MSDDPAADQALDDTKKTRSKSLAEGVLHLYDVLHEGPIHVDSYTIDAVVNVVVVQSGDGELHVEDFRVKKNKLTVVHTESNILIGTFEFDAAADPVEAEFLSKFQEIVEMLAITEARNTPEKFWDYRLVD